MKPAWPDWSVLVALLLTLALVFALVVFSQRPRDPDGPPLLWRSPASERGDSLQI